jgi:DNA topoisomerase-1
MSYTLVIVESPAKCQKIENYLGPGYKCIASFGHLQELKSLKDIDISNNFMPNFNPIESKQKQINKIKQLLTYSKEVILATDDDREGEAISWHICKLFNLSTETTKRIIFHEITKPAITKAINNPTTINMNIVNAQFGRQILDLLVGYKISPILWSQISRTKNLSAGRCQTPALRLVYENQLDIDNSPGTKSYNTIGYFTDKIIPFSLNYNYDNEEKMVLFLENTTEHNHILSCDKPKESIRKSPTPFTTSTLQQTSSNELHISPKDTMQICQKLYEGGYITYMRTDSKIYSKDFVDTTIQYITSNYGNEYITNNIEALTNSSIKTKKSNKKETDNIAQEAHEAIRPTNITIKNLPEESDFNNREKKLYYLIWKNTLESCMADAVFKTMLARISAPQSHEYRYTSELLVFLGWKIIDYNTKKELVIDNTKKMAYEYLPKITNKTLIYKKIISKFSLKDLKSHYTEAKLVQLLEQKGIGRPSTFSSLIEKIQQRGYVKKENIKGKTIKCSDFELENDEILETETEREFGNEKNKLIIQQTGLIVIKLLIEKYSSIFNYEYTKTMEDYLDIIAKGDKKYFELCSSCLKEIDTINNTINNNNREDIKIDNNHTFMIAKHGPVIKKNNNGKTEFISIKKDINIDKLKNGNYKLEEIIEDNTLDKILGKYQNNNILLKKGKFGLYITWGENKKSINDININENDIKLEDVIDYITNSKNNTNILRDISKDISIRKGQYGHYIFYKTSNMNKPRFIKLNDFKEDYLNCDVNLIISFVKEKIK